MSWLDSLTIDGVTIPAWRGIKGLAGSPPPKADTRDRARRHGLLDRTSLYQARLIEVDNAVLAGDPADIWAALDELKAAFALGSDHLVQFQRTGLADAERVVARVAGELSADLDYASQGVILWSVPLLAADPRIYSDVLKTGSYVPGTGSGGMTFPLAFPLSFSGSSSTELTIENDGTFETPPVWTITGPAVNPQIVNDTTGEVIATTGLTLLATDTLVIDVAARTATIDGTARADVIDPSQTSWGELAVGVNTVRLSGTGFDPATTQLSVSFRDARI